MTTTPTPRPVPTTEDRMRDARTEIDHAINLTVEAHNAAYHPGQPCPEDGDDRCAALPRRSTGTDRTFATYLDRTERDQLDAKAAAAEQERDEALDDRDAYKEARDVPRKQLDQVQQRNRDLLRQKRDTISALAAELGDAHDLIAEIRNNRANDDRALARWETRQTGQAAVEPDDTDPDAVQNLLDDATRAFADAGTSSERVEVIRDLLAGWYAAWPASAVTDEHEGIAHQLVALVYAAEARVSPPSSVPPRRAQEGPVMVPLAGWGGGHSRVPARRVQEPGREEVRWAYRWLDADGNVHDEVDTRDNARETAEDRARRLARNRPPSVPAGQVVRYRVVTTEEVVATYPAEREG